MTINIPNLDQQQVDAIINALTNEGADFTNATVTPAEMGTIIRDAIQDEKTTQKIRAGNTANDALKAACKHTLVMLQYFPAANITTIERRLAWQRFDFYIAYKPDLFVPPFDDPDNPNRPEWLAAYPQE